MSFNNPDSGSHLSAFACAFYSTRYEPEEVKVARLHFSEKGIKSYQLSVSSPNGHRFWLVTSADLSTVSVDDASFVKISFGPDGTQVVIGRGMACGETVKAEPICEYYTLIYGISDGTLRVSLDELSYLQLWYGSQNGAFVVSSDLHCLRRVFQPQLDETAIRLLLAYQSMPPLLSPFKGITSLPALHSMYVKSPQAEPELSAMLIGKDTSLSREDDLANCSEAMAIVSSEVIALSRGKDNIVSFSGGIDSAYIACRIKELGAKCVLAHYAFDENGSETRRAREMAADLGFPIEIIDSSQRDDSEMLESIGKAYSYPFGDLGAITSFHLAKAISRIARPEALIWDGTSADSLLAISAQNQLWHRLHSLPKLILQASASIYESGCWQRQNRAEYVLRTLWRANHQVFPYSAAAMKLPFSGMVTRLTSQEKLLFRELYERYVFSVFDHETAAIQPREILGTFHRSARQVAPKGALPLLACGIVALLPFMSRRVMRAALSIRPQVKYSYGASKPILTRFIARFFSEDILTQPKTGFSPSNQSLLESKTALAELNGELNSQDNPLNELIDMRLMRRGLRMVTTGVRIDTHIHKTLWTYLFTSLWLRG